MRRTWLLMGMGLLLAGGWIGPVQARVTEKVEGMIAENSPLKVNDNDLWIQVGGPLVFGLQYDKFATANVALGIGAGSYIDGLSVDLSIKYFFLSGKFSPFLGIAPVFYYSRSTQNVFALSGVAGLSYYFDSGLGLSLGFCYVRSISQSTEPFSYSFVNDKINWPSPQIGLHWNY
jgi:hypothetical protein